MKVLFVATVVKTHINAFHLPYIKMFKDKGWETAVCAKNDFENKEDCVIPNCDKFYDLPFERNPFKLNNIKVFKKLRKLIKEEKYDIIHCHTPTGGVLARLAAKLSGSKKTRVIYTAHGFHFYKGAPIKNWLLYFPIEWLCSFLTDTLITINKEDFEFAQKLMHAKEIKYVPGVGIDTEKFANVTCDKAQKRKELGIPENATVLLSVGELNANKNHETVIKATSNLDVYYIIVGQGGLEEHLKSVAQNHNISDRVKFLGFRNDIVELCKSSDIFVFPSFREGLPVALMEAMASGLPCVASKIRGNTDLIDEGKGGFLFTLDDSDDLTKKLSTIINDVKLAKYFGNNNIAKIKNFENNVIFKTLDNVYFSK